MKTARSRIINALLTATVGLAAGLSSQNVRAGFATPGQGLTNVLTGSVSNGALFCGTVPSWINSPPVLPYTNQVGFALPACDRVVISRLIMTVWGGTANYSCQMTVTINGTNLPGASPLVFGTTSDTNVVFNATSPCAYGAGSGLWLVTLPVPGDFLFKDGSSNIVQVAETAPDSFDGRLHHVTLVAVCQSAGWTNTLNYALAEGSGDIYGTPTAPQVDQRTVTLGAFNPTNATAATLTALYTYGDTGQNDRLYFNGSQLGGDDIAQWDKTGTGMNYGPSVVSFDVLASLAATNTVRFDVSAADVPGTRETSLRPQVALLIVTYPNAPLPPTLAIDLQPNAVQLTLIGETGRSYTIESAASLATTWAPFTNFVSTSAIANFVLPATNASLFFRARTP